MSISKVKFFLFFVVFFCFLQPLVNTMQAYASGLLYVCPSPIMKDAEKKQRSSKIFPLNRLFATKFICFVPTFRHMKNALMAQKKRLPLQKTLCALFVCVTFFRLRANRSRGSVAKILCTKILLRSGDIPLRTVFAPTGRFH